MTRNPLTESHRVETDPPTRRALLRAIVGREHPSPAHLGPPAVGVRPEDIMDTTNTPPPCCFTDATEALDQRMYAAYNRGGDPATAGLNYQGKPCPTWWDLPENVRAKWGVAATEARDFLASKA